MTGDNGENAVSAKSTSNSLASIDEDPSARFKALVTAVNGGNDNAAKELHELCQAIPALWEQLGGLEQNALDSWKRLIVPGSSNHDAFVRDRISAELARRRKDLCAGDVSPLEVLLINRILSAWLQVMYADSRYAQLQQHQVTFTELDYAQKRLDRAQRQLLRAIQALATVRRLMSPTQVNIGQNQINIVQ
jgi:hypothetical protein